MNILCYFENVINNYESKIYNRSTISIPHNLQVFYIKIVNTSS